MYEPTFSAQALADLAQAFYRRGKSIRYRGNFGLTRELEGVHERLNVDHSDLSKLQIRLSVWSTGDWWLLVCKPRPGRNGGWLFKHELRGKLHPLSSEKIVQSFEDSMLASQVPANQRLAQLQRVWAAWM